jgi:glycosyltransferase involved in cell wall biosynthesis
MGVEVFRLQFAKPDFVSMRARTELFRTIAAWSRKGEIQIVEVPDPEGWAALWPKLPVPVVARIHGSIAYFAAELNRHCNRLTFWTERASLRRADFWSSVSRYAGDRTREIFQLRSPGAVLYPAVELPSESEWSARTASKVVYSGTLTLKKGILALIKAWPLIWRQARQAELHMFGKDTPAPSGEPMTEYLLSHLDAEVRASVVFHGHAPKADLVNALRTARAAVYPSYAEAFAATPMEAMAQGCPTVYSSRTSGAELIEHGRDGFLIDPDRPEEIAASVLALLNDEALARRIGAAGRERVRKHYTIETVVPQLTQFYGECIDRFASPGRLSVPVCSSQS